MTTSITFNLLLTDFSNIEKINVYRSSTPHDRESLGESHSVIARSTEKYTDETVEFGKTYYYLLESVFNNGDKRFSNEQKVTIGEMLHFVNNSSRIQVLNFDGNFRDDFNHGVGNTNYIDIDSQGNLYIGSSSNQIFSYDKEGNERWRSTYPTNNVRDVFYSRNGIVYVGDSSGYVSKISASDGENIVQIRPNSSAIWKIFVDDHDRVYSVHSSNVYAYSEDDEYMWHHDPNGGSTLYSIAVDPSGYVYTGAINNTITKFKYDGEVGDNFNPYSFTEEWSLTLDSTVWDIKLRHEYDDEVYVLTQNSIYILNRMSGDIIANFNVDNSPRRLVVTEMKYFIPIPNGSSSTGIQMYYPDGTLFWHETVVTQQAHIYDGSVLPGKQSIAYGFHARS